MIWIDIMLVTFNDLEFTLSDIPKIRGYFANKYKNNVEFHNHIGESYNYKFPEIQFRVINQNPTLLGINQGIDVLKNIVFYENELIINKEVISINEKTISLKKYAFGQTDDTYEYCFISPWMALKEENFKKYILLENNEKNDFLNHLLRENLKSLSKGFNYFIPDVESIIVNGKYFPIKVNFKDQVMLCFKGYFKTNFMIPDYLGIGKQSARGFGTVVNKGVVL